MPDARAHGTLTRMRPAPGQEGAVREHLFAWHRTAGRTLPGTRLHLLLESGEGEGARELTALHLFESAAAFRRAAESEAQREWAQALAGLLAAPPEVREVAVGWNAAADARPRVAVSIDRDVHATVQDLIGRLLDRYPRTPAEDAYLAMLQSIADDYEREFPLAVPDEGDPR